MNYTKNKSNGVLCIYGNVIKFSNSERMYKKIILYNQNNTISNTFASKNSFKYEFISVSENSIFKLDKPNCKIS